MQEEMIAVVQRLFAYDQWANQETLASLKATANPPGRSLRFFAHIVGCECLWLSRLNHQQSPVSVWPDMNLVQCETLLTEVSAAFAGFVNELTREKLLEQVHYVNSKGEPWSNSTFDILLQVVMHSIAHRGQIAADLRATGFTPAYTDFIHAIRQGFVR